MSRPCHRGLVDPLAHAKIECHAAQDAGLLSAEGLFADQEVDGLMDADLTAAKASSRGKILSETFGIKTLLLEGGGKINGSFLKAGLIDEISVLIYPGVDGLAGVASIFEYVGKPDEKPAEGQSLRHIGTETLDGGMVWLRYAVEKS